MISFTFMTVKRRIFKRASRLLDAADGLIIVPAAVEISALNLSHMTVEMKASM